MYLSSPTQSLEIILDSSVTIAEPMYLISYNDINNSGMVLPQSSTQGTTNGTTPVTALSSPTGSTNRQIYNFTLYNNDSSEVAVTIRKDITGTKYNIIKSYLAPGATLMWSRESGWKVFSGNSNQSGVISREYSSDSVWAKPPGLRAAIVVCVGAGGGGGSGRLDVLGTTRGGGGGGGGGSMCKCLFLAEDLPSSVPVIVGIGGAGGAGVGPSTSNGLNGVNGTSTYFGSLVHAPGGNGGSGGTTTTVSGGGGGSQNNCSYFNGIMGVGGANGAQGSTTGSAGFTSLTGSATASAAPGGAGGSGITNLNVANSTSRSGGSLYNNGVFVAGPPSGTPGTLSAATYLYLSTTYSSTIGIGTGGAGGISTFPNGTDGGYGAGGGGGFGQVDTSSPSGKGGNGGGGICLILELY